MNPHREVQSPVIQELVRNDSTYRVWQGLAVATIQLILLHRIEDFLAEVCEE